MGELYSITAPMQPGQTGGVGPITADTRSVGGSDVGHDERNDQRVRDLHVQYETPLTKKGDIFCFSKKFGDTRLGVGTNGQILSSDSTQDTGLRWIDPAAGSSDFIGAPLPYSDAGPFLNEGASTSGTLTGTNKIIGSSTYRVDVDWSITNKDNNSVILNIFNENLVIENAFVMFSGSVAFQWNATAGGQSLAVLTVHIYQNGSEIGVSGSGGRVFRLTLNVSAGITYHYDNQFSAICTDGGGP